MYDLNYDDICNNYEKLLEYCLIHSDSFSVITTLKKPYSHIHPIFEHKDILDSWKPFLLKRKIGVKSWSCTITKGKHYVILFYNSNMFWRKMSVLPNLFCPFEKQLPEDVCFYRGKSPWLSTTSHEKTAVIYNETPEDMSFLFEIGIQKQAELQDAQFTGHCL